MAIPESGPLAEYGTIGVELGVAQTNVSIRGMSQTAGFTEPDAFSEFYGYSGAGCEDIVDNYDPFDGNGVALYQLNGNANDVSGNYNGTASNVTYGAGVFGQAAQFNGSNSGILINDSAALRLTGSYTVSFWLKINSTGSLQRIINKDDGTDFSAGYAFFIQPSGTFGWTHNDGSNNQNWDGIFSPSVGVWYNICAVYSDSSNLRTVYVNGASVASIATNTNIAAGTDSLNFGYIPVYNQRLNGSLDQVRIFNEELTPLEVEALYTEELCICDGTVDTLDILGDGSCIATYQLDGNANDLSGNYSGTPTNVSYGVGEFDLAGVFNGSSSYVKFPNSFFNNELDHSFSVWVNLSSYISSSQIFFAGDTNLRVNSNGTLKFRRYSVPVAYDIDSSTVLTLGQWYNVVCTYNTSSGMAMYINNALQGTNAYTGLVDNISIYSIGARADGPSGFMAGSIDQVRVFNKALNSTEVTTLYNETACASKINLDRDPIRHWGLDNTLASTKSGYSPLLKTSASYTTGRFGQALTFARGNTASETSTFYGDIWTDVTKASFLQGSISFWFKPGSINQRNIVTYCEKIPPFGLEFASNNKLSITSFLSTNTYSPETYGTSDIIFVCITAYRTGGVGSTQTCNFTMYYSSVSENNLKSISNSGTSTESTYTTTFCLGHGASSVGFDGWIDQFRLFDKPLNAEQVQELFDEQPY